VDWTYNSDGEGKEDIQNFGEETFW